MPYSPRIRAEELFQRTVELPPAERAAELVRSCQGDPALRREVESLLASHDGVTADFLQTRGADGESGAGDLFVADDIVGDKYKLIHILGEGGLGVVWLAEQKPPVRRKVAIKFIRLGMTSEDVLGRFETERNALELMNHANIARVLDAGTAQGGQPFFVMEYVQGLPITKFCDHERLTTRRRLELFREVCSAVQHAHQKGIIHRDIKPSNILVMLNEGQPVPKVIDFGIAKATGQDLADRTLVTMPGQMLGTPEYMSPEQAEMSEIGVDSTTDIYSLGVLLYELLTGTLPFESETLRRRGLAEMHRVLLEVDPPKPSTRISTLGAATPAICEKHRADARTLRSELQGDLDWIVMKALMKERTRRYASASEFAADVDRCLRDEPVLATPPSQLYRLRKFARRNRAAVTLMAIAVVALIGGIMGATLGMLEAQEATGRAKSAQLGAEHNSRREAAVGVLLLHGIGFMDESAPDAEQLTVMAMLDKAEVDIPTLFPRIGEELEQAAARTMLSTIYYLVDENTKAKAQLDKAIELLEQHGPYHPDLLEPLHQLAHVQSLIADHEHAHDTNRRIAGIAWRALEPSELRDALAALAHLTYESGQPPQPSKMQDAVRSVLEAVNAHRGSALELERAIGSLQNIAWTLEDRLQLSAEAQPLNRCVWYADIDTASWSFRIIRMWAGWHLLRGTKLSEESVGVARGLLRQTEFFPANNPTRRVMCLQVADTLSHAGIHDKAIQLATSNCEFLSVTTKNWHNYTEYQLRWAAQIFAQIMDVCRRAKRMPDAIGIIRRSLVATELDATGRRQALWTWEVVRRGEYSSVMSHDDYRQVLRIAERGLAQNPERPVLGQVAAATTRLRLGTNEELQRARAMLEPLVADVAVHDVEPSWDWHCLNAIAPLAIVQQRLGDTEAAKATLQFARELKRKGQHPGDMFDEAVALIDPR